MEPYTTFPRKDLALTCHLGKLRVSDYIYIFMHLVTYWMGVPWVDGEASMHMPSL